jgi:replicative DNA helicase
MIVESLYDSIRQGKSGLNMGLSTGMPKVDSLTYGIQRKWLTVVAGDSGSGKSSYVLYTKVFKAFQQYQEDKSKKIHFLLFSFEMSAEVLLAKLLSTYIYEKYNKIISYDEILSLTSTLSDEDWEIIQESRPWLEELESLCEIIDKPVNAKGLYAICKEWSKKFGDYEEIEKTDDYVKVNYVPSDPQQYLIVVVDHIKLLSVSSGHTPKQEIDEACDYLIHFRNKCSFNVNIVQQLNRNFKSMDRRQNGYQLLQLDDLSDSSGPAQAAETVIGIFHPFREKMTKCEGYDVRILKDRIRLCQVLKNRFGLADKSVGVCFYGENSVWKELPLPNEINDYEPFTHL